MIMVATPPAESEVAANNSNNSVSRNRGEEIFMKSLLMSKSRTTLSSLSSKPRKSSFRRRDVIQPLVLEETAAATAVTNTTPISCLNRGTVDPDVLEKSGFKMCDDSSTQTTAVALPSNNNATLVLHPLVLQRRQEEETQPHHNNCGLELDPSGDAKWHGNNIDTLVVYDHNHQNGNARPRLDPPGEIPTNHPIVCTDLIVRSDNSLDNFQCRTNYNKRNPYTVLWVDPKSVHDPNAVDWKVLRQYDRLMSSSSTSSITCCASYHYNDASARALASSSSSLPTTLSSSPQHVYTSLLLSNPRTRIATISTGFKAAMFFVREDLDTRIYFNQLEDAIGYMGRRGYVKMRPEEEKEWRMILEKAHRVVKVGPTKRKQLYRKGKIVLLLKKTIANEEDGNYHNHVRKMMVKKKNNQPKSLIKAEAFTLCGVRNTKHKSLNDEDENSQATATTTPSTNDNEFDDFQSSSSSSSHNSNITETDILFTDLMPLDSSVASTTAQTDRTSLGRSTRWPYKSYSDKFLAQQDEEKRQFLLAIMEGRPLVSATTTTPLLLLTDGEDGLFNRRRPIDPDADIIPGSVRSGYNNDDLRSGTQFDNSTSRDMATRTTIMEESNKSFHTMRGSARRGVYGGGVRYFTPDYSFYSDSDDNDDAEVEEDNESNIESGEGVDVVAK